MRRLKPKNKGIEFRIGKSVNMIPSKMFPLASTNVNNIRVLNSETTEEIKDEKVKEVFNSYKYRLGKCFYNSRDLKDLLEEKGMSGWEYYSGWLFPFQGYPVFHALLVKDNHVLDYTNSVFTEKNIEKISELNSFDEIREFILNDTREKETLLPSETKIFGKMHKEYVFIGTKDTFENSINIMENLPKQHPSYSNKGMNRDGLSDFQKEI